ncbi:DUF2334 domain-containing protein [Thermococcus sp.]|uniref:DUF2334 domain-containing protein n=1 Tax=Thermococcus sp. TaxID=35749 RepID=UPI002635348A|nr:DUF2334 domain-containing protein [Thermococcus sp.]
MKKVVPILVAFVFLSSSSLSTPVYLPNLGHLVILLHDVSPGYYPQLRQLTEIIDSYGLQNETYLFVIPNHGGEMPLNRYTGFAAFLRNLSDEGYHIELHGYDHVGKEFDCDSSTAKEKLDLGLRTFKECYLPYPRYFIAPRYSLSGDALRVLLLKNFTVIDRDFIYFPNGTVPILNREYTWYMPSILLSYQLTSVEESYRNCRCTFFLSLHPRAANNEAGLEFLRKFLGFTVRDKVGRG